jgi:hypothetical protein
MNFNNLDKLCATLIILFIVLGFSNSVAADDTTNTDQVAWIAETSPSLVITYLEANIHVIIKNNNDHAEFFKISQQYTADGSLSPAITWKVASAPGAVKMAKNINAEGDLGWEIDSGQTRDISFKLVSNSTPGYISRNGSMANTFWPIINEPGISASWFLPNEIEYLNTNLDLQLWQGRFCFFLTNIQPTGPRVEGIMRAPIVPIDSALTASSPTVDFIDDEMPSANTAAWDVTLYPGQTKHYSYTYQWPNGTSVTPVNRQTSDQLTTQSTAKNPVSVPTKTTGVPYGLFVVGGVVIAAGIVYARFLR